jgi:hypothetical protein
MKCLELARRGGGEVHISVNREQEQFGYQILTDEGSAQIAEGGQKDGKKHETCPKFNISVVKRYLDSIIMSVHSNHPCNRPWKPIGLKYVN